MEQAHVSDYSESPELPLDTDQVSKSAMAITPTEKLFMQLTKTMGKNVLEQDSSMLELLVNARRDYICQLREIQRLQQRVHVLESSQIEETARWTKIRLLLLPLRSSYGNDAKVAKLTSYVDEVHQSLVERSSRDKSSTPTKVDSKQVSRNMRKHVETNENEDIPSNQSEHDVKERVPRLAEIVEGHENEEAETPGTKLSLEMAVPMKTEFKEPCQPRSRKASGTSKAQGSSLKRTENLNRQRFHFAEAEIQNFMNATEDPKRRQRNSLAPRHTPTLNENNVEQTKSSPSLHRRGTSGGMSVALRRQSFTIKRSPSKLRAAGLSSRRTNRRKSTTTLQGTSSLNDVNSIVRRPSTSRALVPSSSSMSLVRTGSRRGSTRHEGSPSRLIVRVQKNESSGKSQVVIRKCMAKYIAWQWKDRSIRPPAIERLGPHQHSMMLRQLRFVKSLMHEFPWAKSQLRDLLSKYTKQTISKEALYPQLAHLSHQVSQELEDRTRKNRDTAVRKQKLTTKLSIAAGVINESQLVKFGRRGKPHESRLWYVPNEPKRLHWLNKQGGKSDEWLSLHRAAIVYPYGETREEEEEFAEDRSGSGSRLSAPSQSKSKTSPVLQKAIRKKQATDLKRCVVISTPERTLDLQLTSEMNRDWMVDALTTAIDFAKQYHASERRQAHLQRQNAQARN